MGIKLEQLIKANDSLVRLLYADIEKYDLDDFLIDGLLNGIIQKFEYTTDLAWKSVREFLIDKDGLQINSPKQVFKEFYSLNYLDENMYLELINALNDRNVLSHVYDEQEMQDILAKIKIYAEAYKNLIDILNK
jgi:nucleotidyltransferase substrate binding protein (TIGR01987 family)